MTVLTLIERVRQMSDARLAAAIEAARGCGDPMLTTALDHERRRRSKAEPVFTLDAETARRWELVCGAR